MASDDRTVECPSAPSGPAVAAEIGADGELLVRRGGAVVLRGAIPTCVGWRDEEARAASVDVRPVEDGIVIEAVAAEADHIELSIDLASGRHWYGMGELLHQRWPLEEVALQRSPFLTWDNGISGVGNVLEPVWFSAPGVALWVAPGDPDVTTVSLNRPPDGATVPTWEPALSVRAPADRRPFASNAVGGDGRLTLRFAGDRLRVTLVVGENVRDAHQGFITRAGKPAVPPAPGSLTLPIWTTWARFKEAIDQGACLRFADEIQGAGFPIGTLEIDDKWQVEYGDLAFDPQRFPDPRAMIDDLHARGIGVNAWIVPFIDPKATVAREAVAEGYVVRRPSGEPHVVTWWHDPAHIIDISDPRAEAWFADRLARLQRETGLDGFKFDAGEGCYLPADAVTTGDLGPNDYSHRYAEFVSCRFPGSDVRTAWRNQRGTFLLREWDKHSEWGLGNGLQSVLTQALTFGLIGYPFVLPDMIGGNEYGGQHADDELLVRWAQVNALLPQMQFSVAPWERGPEVARLTRDAAELHIRFAPEIERLAEEAVATGAPIVRPLLYEFPDDPLTETIWDEFMLGDRWLVAPVVEPGALARDVYFPQGRWLDDAGVMRDGGRWELDLSAPLDRLPYFERLDRAR